MAFAAVTAPSCYALSYEPECGRVDAAILANYLLYKAQAVLRTVPTAALVDAVNFSVRAARLCRPFGLPSFLPTFRAPWAPTTPTASIEVPAGLLAHG